MSASDTLQPIRGSKGASCPGPAQPRARPAESSICSPRRKPITACLPNLGFSLSQAHNRLEEGGWAREVTARELPVSASMAGVNMRLGPGVVRELHWHKEAEWGYVTEGRVRVTVVDVDRSVFVDDLQAGRCVALSRPAFRTPFRGSRRGCEFLLVFDDGDFSEDQTLLITEWFAHTPREVLAKNFERAGSLRSRTSRNPQKKTSFPCRCRNAALNEALSELPEKRPCLAFHLACLGSTSPPAMPAARPRSSMRASSRARRSRRLIIELEPGGMRELHWHPRADEWQYYMEGEARMTVFDATSNARTFNYRAGDVGFVPRTLGHYIENTGSTPVRVINVFNSPVYEDISLNQWMALTPPDLVKGHLNLDDTAMRALRRDYRPVVR